MKLAIEVECEFIASGPSTNTSAGMLYTNSDGTYQGIGHTGACPYGKFTLLIDSYDNYMSEGL